MSASTPPGPRPLDLAELRSCARQELTTGADVLFFCSPAKAAQGRRSRVLSTALPPPSFGVPEEEFPPPLFFFA